MNTPPGPMEATPPPLRRLALIGCPPGPKPIPIPPRPPATHITNTSDYTLNCTQTQTNVSNKPIRIDVEHRKLLLGNCGGFSAGRTSSGGSDLSSYNKTNAEMKAVPHQHIQAEQEQTQRLTIFTCICRSNSIWPLNMAASAVKEDAPQRASDENSRFQ